MKKRFIFTDHLKDQMARRHVTKLQVDVTVQSPDCIAPDGMGLTGKKRRYIKEFRGRTLEVIVVEEDKKLIGLTCIWV